MGSISLKTQVPGPVSLAMAERSAGAVPRPLTPYGKVWAARGEGAVLEDVDGNRFIDMIGGVGCLVAGHSHPKVVDAVVEQARRFTHTDFSLIPYEGYTLLAERISELCGGGRKVGFFNSGAEAVENAVKIARAATGRPGIICFEGAFHGRTFMAMSLTHREQPYKLGFGPFVPEVYRAPYPGFDGATLEDSLSAVEAIMTAHEVAGAIVEPVLGEAGFIPAADGFLPGLAGLCELHGSVLIADEIQSGYGRTGTFLASDHSGVRPGLVTLAKSIAAGIPLSAVVGDPRWFDALSQNAVGGTYVGNPVAQAAAHAVLDVMEGEGLLARAKAIGEALTQGWSKVADGTDVIVEVRGLGAMVGVVFKDAAAADAVIDGALQRGVIAMKAGRDGDVIRHLMPLVITDEQVDEAMEVFASAVRAI